jgi:hypothetical protein
MAPQRANLRANNGTPLARKFAMEPLIEQCATFAVGGRITVLRFGRR